MWVTATWVGVPQRGRGRCQQILQCLEYGQSVLIVPAILYQMFDQFRRIVLHAYLVTPRPRTSVSQSRQRTFMLCFRTSHSQGVTFLNKTHESTALAIACIAVMCLVDGVVFSSDCVVDRAHCVQVPLATTCDSVWRKTASSITHRANLHGPMNNVCCSGEMSASMTCVCYK